MSRVTFVCLDYSKVTSLARNRDLVAYAMCQRRARYIFTCTASWVSLQQPVRSTTLQDMARPSACPTPRQQAASCFKILRYKTSLHILDFSMREHFSYEHKIMARWTFNDKIYLLARYIENLLKT